MASTNRAAQINKVLKVLKKHYKPVPTPPERTVLEHLMFACCLENSLHEEAEKVFEVLSTNYFDWNEVRVSSIRELSEVMKPLNDAQEAATRLKRVLQSVFETHYSFDIDILRKQNLGQSIKQLQKYNGTSPFTVSYVVQFGLAGHSIPINRGLREAMRVVGVISDAEASKGTVPGLERAIPKTKGPEVGSQLHQLGVELYRSPYGPTIRKVLLEIEPACKDQLPKRPSKKVAPAEAKPDDGESKSAAKKDSAKAPSKVAAPKKKVVKKKTSARAAETSKKKSKVKTSTANRAAAKKPVKKKVAKKSTAAKKKAATKKLNRKPR